MNDTATAATAETSSVPTALTTRADDPKRLVQASRALHVLETDLRHLLKKVPFDDIDDSAVQYAVTTYGELRTAVITSLDEEGQAAASDAAIGMPEIEDGTSFSTLLLKLSQATRFVGVEEGWPGLFVASKALHHQLGEHMRALDSSGPAASVSAAAVLSKDGDTGYL